MNAREAKKWACDMAAALLRSDMDGGVIDDDDPDGEKKRAAMNEVIRELERRGR